MTKKIFCVLLTLLLTALLPAAALADVIWEPYDDDFYIEHSADCVYEGRSYTVTDTLQLYTEPGKAGNGTIPTGSKLEIAFIYTDDDGTAWGVCKEDDSHWVEMSALLLIYDNISFIEEYGAEFTPCEEQPDAAFYANDTALYEYPGSASVVGTISADSVDETNLPAIAVTYRDDNGVTWGRVDYFIGQEGWLQLSPVASVTPADDSSDASSPVAAVTPADDSADATSPDKAATSTTEPQTDNNLTQSRFFLPAILVIALVGITTIVIVVLFRDKRRKTQS